MPEPLWISHRPASLFVHVVWAAMFAWALGYVWRWSVAFPTGDELALFELVPPMGAFTLGRLLQPHNEHFMPLPRLLQFAAYSVGGLRGARFLEVAILGVASFALISAARRIRGRTGWTDVIFPLLLLHTGNGANLLNGFQLAMTIPTALVVLVLATLAVAPGPPSQSSALRIGLALVALPLSGGAGVSQAPPLLAWAVWSAMRAEQPAKRILLAGSAISVVILAAGVLIVSASGRAIREVSSHLFWPHGAALLALALGPAAVPTWPASGGFVLAVAGITTGLLAAKVGTEPLERTRRLGLLAMLAATFALVAVVSLGRAQSGWQNGFAPRYVSLTAPLLACAHLAWTAYGGRISGRLVPALLALVAAALLPLNLRAGEAYAHDRPRAAAELEAIVHGGARTSEILAHYSERFYVAPALARPLLAWLALEHRPPFDEGPGIPASSFEYPMFDRAPVAMESPSPTSQRFVDREWVLATPAGGRIHLPLQMEEKRLSARFEIPARLANRPWSRGARVRIELVEPGGAARVLFDRELDPAVRESDRGVQSLELELPPHAAGEIVLVTDVTASGRADRTWLYWREITIR